MLAALFIPATAAVSAGGRALFEDEDEDEVGEVFNSNKDNDDEDE
jgi:hypothetical protein